MNDTVNPQSLFSWFSALDVEHGINKLKMGKRADTDSMQGKHFKYTHSKVTEWLSMLLNSMIYTTIYLMSLWRSLLFLYFF